MRLEVEDVSYWRKDVRSRYGQPRLKGKHEWVGFCWRRYQRLWMKLPSASVGDVHEDLRSSGNACWERGLSLPRALVLVAVKRAVARSGRRFWHATAYLSLPEDEDVVRHATIDS